MISNMEKTYPYVFGYVLRISVMLASRNYAFLSAGFQSDMYTKMFGLFNA